jgi:hypothetical protein
MSRRRRVKFLWTKIDKRANWTNCPRRSKWSSNHGLRSTGSIFTGNPDALTSPRGDCNSSAIGIEMYERVSRSLGEWFTLINFWRHPQCELYLVRAKDERPDGRENNVRRGLQDGVWQISWRALVVVDGHDIFSRRNIRQRELKKLIFDPNQLFARNRASLRIRRDEFELGPVHHMTADLDTGPSDHVLERNGNDASR